jgi:hypothetical protein
LESNLATLHRKEERLRSEHLKLIEKREDLGDHIKLIQDAMNVIWAFTHDHTHRSDDELTLQFLGIRLFNTAASSIKLAHAGYYQNAFSALRDLLETYFLVDYLCSNRHQISEWRAASNEELRGRFGPNAIRQALDKRDGFKEGKRKIIYDLISHHATHATPSGFRMTVKDQLGEIGPFYSEENFVAWIQEAVKMLSHVGIIFASAFTEVEDRFLLLKSDYIQDLNAWKRKHFGGPDVWTEI